MNGSTLSRKVQELLNETSTGSFMSSHTTYDYIYDAVKDFNFRTHYQVATQTIPIVAGTTSYNLNTDFSGMALMDRDNREYIKWTYGGNDTFIFNEVYANVIINNVSGSASIPSSWSVVTVDQDSVSNITGTATSAGATTNGECTLTDTAANFTLASVGDNVFNTTDGSSGVIIEIVSGTQVKTALFDGTANDWTGSDAYVIVPQSRYKIVFSPEPSATATATIVYVKRPAPVYAPYRSYKLPPDAELAIVKFAAFMYKYKDREANFGDALFKYYDAYTRRVANELRRGITEKSGFRVNLSKRQPRSRSLGGYTR